MRKEGDSNPRTALDGYTLSRRASSATRAPFRYQLFMAQKLPMMICDCKGKKKFQLMPRWKQKLLAQLHGGRVMYQVQTYCISLQKTCNGIWKIDFLIVP